MSTLRGLIVTHSREKAGQTVGFLWLHKTSLYYLCMSEKLAPHIEALLPHDKSWMIRLGVLDLLLDYTDMEEVLGYEKPEALGTDLQALLRVSHQWRQGEPIDVGESGTLFRFLQFAVWSRGETRNFVRRGTLTDRPIIDDPSIVNLPLRELLKLDNGTSQWASAAVLLGNKERPADHMPYKLEQTYAALDHWSLARLRGERWVPKKDGTITKQTMAYLGWLGTGDVLFEPEQAEDYCFARAFDLMTAEQGEARWPSLRQHESDRIASMEEALNTSVVDSADHRVVQAVAMRKGEDASFTQPDAVAKSWPRFWELINMTRGVPQ